ncbi:pseudouridine synthase [Talaromyces stipitatus ATCC 10500]|uniref:tRNA pseudouridine(55) synthase n=1 Tax=Talaromyces stipitatus (strain ATCC 10500 / CBS 375.48 / QM 6759 / NRRL 1006) TaxID=441959 RepID=B8M345_TALSN|nr:pseudouridine synthase [Talaromyces stipitatus ATCC 10500]EED22021.1 pseudouridine synthase [Talaromyces stipitatus ATCC 10500]
MTGGKIYEGILPVHKPEGVTSADVLRKLQKHFNPSTIFRPWIENEISRRKNDANFRNRRKKRPEVKIGHGGTLDPMATGVLITGIGRGTKNLIKFLECRKTYETVVLFGAETDTYDRTGKLVRKAPYEHITREVVEEALKKFRGKIMQRPPIFSAKSIQGVRLYEYARAGKEPPVEIKSREVEVYDLQILEWYEPGTHDYKWPEEEMTGEEKEVAQKMLDKEAAIPLASEAEEAEQAAANSLLEDKKNKRKASPGLDKNSATKTSETEAETKRLKSDPEQPSTEDKTTKEEDTNNTKQEEAKEAKWEKPPAAKITMTVSSGFYVRSLAHDLGKAVGSCGLMSSLVRSKQADYTLDSDKILEYADLEAGEELWGPKVIRFLEEWQEKNPPAEST